MNRTKIDYELPRSLPAFIEVEPDVFAGSDEATVAQWKKQKELQRHRTDSIRRAVRRMVQLADAFGIPADVPLLPRLKALTDGNVVALNPKRERP
jgi:hypothetical protein